jgi:hypothetical protein
MSVLRLKKDTRLRSILSKGGSSRRDVIAVVSVEKNGGPLVRNGVVDKDMESWGLWEGTTLSREAECPDSKAEEGCFLSSEIDLGDA